MIKPNVGIGAVKLVHQIYCCYHFREQCGNVCVKKNMFIFSDLEGIFLCIYLNKIIQEKVKIEHCGVIPSSNKYSPK